MRINPTPIAGLYVIELEKISDDRGWFARSFCKREFEAAGLPSEFVQSNFSFSPKKGTFRGFHYPIATHHEVKLVRCLSGSITDIAIDVRKGSPTFLKSFHIELSGENLKMLLIPPGFAHGFLTLEDNSVVHYNHSEYHFKGHERTIRYNDPLLNLNLPLQIEIISAKDQNEPLLPKDFEGVSI